MSASKKTYGPADQSKTPRRSSGRNTRSRTPSLKAVENIVSASDLESIDLDEIPPRATLRRSTRKQSLTKTYQGSGYDLEDNATKRATRQQRIKNSSSKKKGEQKGEGSSSDLEIIGVDDTPPRVTPKRSTRKQSLTKAYQGSQYDLEDNATKRATRQQKAKNSSNDEKGQQKGESSFSDLELDSPPRIKNTEADMPLLEELDVAGRSMYGFNTPKKRGSMALAAMNTPKTSKTPKSTAKTPDNRRHKTMDPKTPSRVRSKVKKQIAKLVELDSGSDFSEDGSEYVPSDDDGDIQSSSSPESSSHDGEEDGAAYEPKTPTKGRRPIIVPVLPKTPSTTAVATRMSTRRKNLKNIEFVPESDGYFQAHSSTKTRTSDHTLDRLKNPRLPVDRLFSLLADMKLSEEHERRIADMAEDYKAYFPKWLILLNEGFSVLLYGLGSKRNLLQCFHREVLKEQTVLVVNGFFPSLTIKDILDSITNEILDIGVSSANPHEAVDMIAEEFGLIPETHLFLIVHNIDGSMLRNGKAQSVLARLAKVPNIHLLASIDHINTPLLWDQTKLSDFNFTWWDCTTMLPYSDETAFENSLLVQNSGELALSSMRSVFLSLTANSRGIFMLIVKYQLQNKGTANYQGMSFKDLYWSCRESFLVSSDLALRAQLTEFLDHKLVKSKRNIDGSEQLTIPIDSTLLQQFLEEQEQQGQGK